MRIADGFSYQETKKTSVCVCGGMVRERHGTWCAAVSSSSCVVPNKNKTFKNFLEQFLEQFSLACAFTAILLSNQLGSESEPLFFV